MSYLPNESGSSVGFRNLQNEVKHHDVWNSEEGAASTSGNSRDNLASLYRPPNHLMFNGPFEKVSIMSLILHCFCLLFLFLLKEIYSHKDNPKRKG